MIYRVRYSSMTASYGPSFIEKGGLFMREPKCTCGDIFAGFPPNEKPGSDVLDSTCPVHGNRLDDPPPMAPETGARVAEHTE